MKANLFLAAGMLITAITTGQNQKLNEIEIQASQFQSGSYKSANDFLASNIGYPTELKSYGIQGTEVIQFVVNPKGNLTDFTVINSLSPVIDDYVIEVLKTTNGKWSPGTANGVPVSMEKEVSVVFFLHSIEQLVKDAKDYLRKGNNLMFEKNNPGKALKYYDWGITLLPYEESLIAMRSLCKFQLGDNEGATKDWGRLKILAERNVKNIDNGIPVENSDYFQKLARIMKTIEK